MRGGQSTRYVCGSQNLIQTCLILPINKHRFVGSLIYGDRSFVYGQICHFSASLGSLLRDYPAKGMSWLRIQPLWVESIQDLR